MNIVMSQKELSMLKIHCQPFLKSKYTEIVSFSKLHPCKPSWSEEYIHKFIFHLISSYELCFDLFVENQRAAFAVLIDKVQNKGNDACLEILGLDQQFDALVIYQHLINQAKAKLTNEKSGIQITVHDSQTKLIELLQIEKFDHYYDLFEMQCKIINNPNALTASIVPLTENDYSQCYEVICLSFADNPEMAIPHYCKGSVIR